MFILKTLIKAVLLPPGIMIALGVVGLALMPRRRKLGMTLVAASMTLLLVLSMPAVSNPLAQSLARHVPLEVEGIPAAVGAIVLLTSGINANSPEYGGDVASLSSVERARYAAFLHRRTGLPILVVGGRPRPSTLSEGEAARRLLEDEWGVPVRWLEGEARDTEESAFNSFKILNREGIGTILLVTHFYHMVRGEFIFMRAGFQVIPAAMGFKTQAPFTAYDLLPSAGALSVSTWVLNEWFGLAWIQAKGLVTQKW